MGPDPRRLSVAVLIDLHLSPAAGGHIRVWQRLAEAAAADPCGIDLTVYCLGDVERTSELSPSVRFTALLPERGFRAGRLLGNHSADTDLSRHHRRLADRLPSHDVYHATDAFAFARTALRLARYLDRPLVYSVHTDLPAFTRIYARRILSRYLGSAVVSRLGLAELATSRMRRHVDKIWRQSSRVLAYDDRTIAEVGRVLPAARIGTLRRGVDKARFLPRPSDRQALRNRYGVPTHGRLLLFVGRVDETKRVMTAIECTRMLRRQGHDVHLMIAGDGADRAAAREALGDAGTAPGMVDESAMPDLYASADLLLFPSVTDVAANATIEALSCGLPIVVAAGGGAAANLARAGGGGVVVTGTEPADWADVVAVLIGEPERRDALAAAARTGIERHWPSWHQVYREDLVPTWRAVAAEAHAPWSR